MHSWEQRKLGDNIVEYTEKTTENNQYPVLTSSRKGIFFQTDYYDGNQIASADNTYDKWQCKLLDGCYTKNIKNYYHDKSCQRGIDTS